MERDRGQGPGREPSTLWDKADLVVRVAAVVAAAVPTTIFPPLWLTQAVTRRYRREALMHRLHRMPEWATFVTRHILAMKVDIEGEDNLPRPSRGHMYVSNHQSYADILLLSHALRTAAFLSKRVPVKYIPLVGRSAFCGGTVFLDRGDKRSRLRALEETLQMCERSTAVVVFPEGTRSADGELRDKIHPKAMQMAHRRGIRLVPIGLHGTYRVAPREMDRFRTGQRVAVRIGVPLAPEEFSSPEAYAAACWDRVASLHREAKDAVALDPGRERSPSLEDSDGRRFPFAARR